MIQLDSNYVVAGSNILLALFTGILALATYLSVRSSKKIQGNTVKPAFVFEIDGGGSGKIPVKISNRGLGVALNVKISHRGLCKVKYMQDDEEGTIQYERALVAPQYNIRKPLPYLKNDDEKNYIYFILYYDFKTHKDFIETFEFKYTDMFGNIETQRFKLKVKHKDIYTVCEVERSK